MNLLMMRRSLRMTRMIRMRRMMMILILMNKNSLIPNLMIRCTMICCPKRMIRSYMMNYFWKALNNYQNLCKLILNYFPSMLQVLNSCLNFCRN